jgi:hypothetical protein
MVTIPSTLVSIKMDPLEVAPSKLPDTPLPRSGTTTPPPARITLSPIPKGQTGNVAGGLNPLPPSGAMGVVETIGVWVQAKSTVNDAPAKTRLMERRMPRSPDLHKGGVGGCRVDPGGPA